MLPHGRPVEQPCRWTCTHGRHGRAVALIVVSALALVAPRLAAQGVSDIERDRTSRMLSILQDRLQRYYYDSTFCGRDGRRRDAQRRGPAHGAGSG